MTPHVVAGFAVGFGLGLYGEVVDGLLRAADAAKAHAICKGRARVSYWQDDDDVVEYRSPVDATLETCEDAAYGQDADR